MRNWRAIHALCVSPHQKKSTKEFLVQALVSLHGLRQEFLAIVWSIATTVFDGLLEVLALLRYNYQRQLVLAKGANFLALRRDVKFLHSSVTQSLPVENSREEPAHVLS